MNAPQTITTNGGKAITRTFDSLADWVDYANSPTDCPTSDRSSIDTSSMMSRFTESDNLDHATTLAHGWTEGAQLVETLAAKLTPQGMKPRLQARMCAVGPGALSMGAYLAGDPAPYVVRVATNAPRAGKGKIVRLVVNLGVSGGVDVDIIRTKGAACLALAVALERAGRRVEIVAVTSSDPSFGFEGHKLTYRINIKSAQDRLHIPTMAFALCHPSMFRRLMFAVMEHEASAEREIYSVGVGYGRPADASKADQDSGIYIGKSYYGERQWDSATKARAWVVSTLADQGVTIK